MKNYLGVLVPLWQKNYFDFPLMAANDSIIPNAMPSIAAKATLYSDGSKKVMV
jgi:hypothetical protein